KVHDPHALTTRSPLNLLNPQVVRVTPLDAAQAAQQRFGQYRRALTPVAVDRGGQAAAQATAGIVDLGVDPEAQDFLQADQGGLGQGGNGRAEHVLPPGRKTGVTADGKLDDGPRLAVEKRVNHPAWIFSIRTRV